MLTPNQVEYRRVVAEANERVQRGKKEFERKYSDRSFLVYGDDGCSDVFGDCPVGDGRLEIDVVDVSMKRLKLGGGWFGQFKRPSN